MATEMMLALTDFYGSGQIGPRQLGPGHLGPGNPTIFLLGVDAWALCVTRWKLIMDTIQLSLISKLILMIRLIGVKARQLLESNSFPSAIDFNLCC